jgi:multidrug efflux pump subunit AcrA (membrane-fusion protein)
VDPATRTLKVRLEAANPGFQLKPDMFVDVEFHVASERKLTVPSEAVLDAGQRKTVFIDRGNGYFEPREVQIGERIGDRVEILKGLEAGERIVTSGNFLIDSESQLRNPHD